MSGTLGKMAPAAIVFVLVGWCCWPYLEAPRVATEVPQGVKTPRISGSQLSPAVEPASGRDPFRPLRAEKADPPESKEPAPPPPPAQGEAPAKEQSTDIFRGLVLDAIYIQGDRRVALINGQVCEQGEPLPISASTTEPCIVAEISADKVLLLHREQTVELKYGGLTFSTNPAEALEQRDE